MNPDRIGLTKKVTVGICGDAKMAAEAISELLSGASPPACLQTTEQRLGQAKTEKEAWEKGMK